MNQRSLLRVLSVLLIVSLALSACVTPPPTASTGASEGGGQAVAGPQGTLTMGLTTDIAAIEVPYAPERQAANASWTLYDALVFPETDGTYSPALAESWEASEDGTAITFKLRQDVTFHNGEAFNADSVVYSWQTYSQPDVTYANEWTFASLVEKIDDFTVKIGTEKPNALLLARIAGWSMIPPKAHAEMGKEKFAQSPIGTGPFVFKEWTKGEKFVVTANPNYWRTGYPKVAEVIFRFLPESATRVAAIQAGEIDIAPRLTSDEADTLRGDDTLNVLNYPVDRVYYLAFNNITTGKETPILDVKVRQAIGHAIDMDTIIESIFGGFATRSVGFLSEGNLGYLKADPVAYDVEKAKALLAEAGHAGGFDIDMACPDAGYPRINEVCQAIQGYLKEAGINADLDLMEANAYWDLESKKELPPLFVDSWSVTINEAYGRLEGALGKDQTYANWEDEKILGLLDQILTTVDIDARAKLYGEVQQYMRDNPPFVYLYFPQAFEGISKRVAGYAPRGAENYYLWDVSVTE